VRIFLSYPSSERETAARVNYALLALGHDVFFDREDLPAGLEYDEAIRAAIEGSDLFVFFITPEAVAKGRYALTELRLAERRWPHPHGRVLPVMLRPTPLAEVPAYLRAVSILEPHGDLAAEVADAVQRMALALRPWGRARRLLGARAARWTLAGALLLAVAAAGVVWRNAAGEKNGTPVSPPSPGHPAPSSGYTPLPPEVGRRARAVAVSPEGYVVAAAGPAQLLRFAADGSPLGDPIALPGEPALVVRQNGILLVATRAPDAVVVMDMSDWSRLDSVGVAPERAVGDSARNRVASEVQSVAAYTGTLWVVTGGSEGTPALLRLRQPEREWVVASWSETPAGLDPRDLRLRRVGEWLWAVSSARTPSTLYRIEGVTRLDTFEGSFARMAACAHALGESAAGHLLLLSCDDRLQEVRVDGRRLSLERWWPVPPPQEARGNTPDEVIERDGESVFVALNYYRIRTPRHTRIVRVSGQGTEVLLDEKDAVATSLAVTQRGVVVVFRRADGTTDAGTLPRRR
jgi:TIR domain-containing protein